MTGYLQRGTVFPTVEVQKTYPLDRFPCSRCELEGLPHLVDNSSEFYWEHQHQHPGSSARSFCLRFNSGRRVRKDTAQPTYYRHT